jgi:hypothetical protein
MAKQKFSNLMEISAQLADIGKQARPAMRRALKRGLLAMKTESIKEIKKTLKITNKDLKESFRLSAPQGDRIFMHADIGYSSASLPMLPFVRGARSPIKQKGISIKRRRKLKVEIVPGRKTLLKGAFIQVVRGRLGVFKRRKGGTRTQLVSQRVHSIVYEVFKGDKPDAIATRGYTVF